MFDLIYSQAAIEYVWFIELFWDLLAKFTDSMFFAGAINRWRVFNQLSRFEQLGIRFLYQHFDLHANPPVPRNQQARSLGTLREAELRTTCLNLVAVKER